MSEIFHPKARAALSERAEAILASMRRFEPEELKESVASFQPDIDRVVITKEEIVGRSPYYENRDAFSGEISRIVYNTGDGPFGIEGIHCKNLEALAGQTIKAGVLSELVSQEFV